MRLTQLVRRRRSSPPASPPEQPVVPSSPRATPTTPAPVAELDRLLASAGDNDAEALVQLRDLRHEAAEAFPAGAGRSKWPPTYPDPFPDQAGLPEVDAGELSTEILGGVVAHHGALVVRGAFDPAAVERSVEAIDRAQSRWSALQSQDAEHETTGNQVVDEDEWYHPLHVKPVTKNQILRNMVNRQGGIWLGDSPAATEQVLADLTDAGIVPAITGHFGERPFFSLQKSTLRRSAPRFEMTAWHQDGSFLTPGVRTMNAWVALSRCGGGRPTPGLEVIPRRFEEVLPVDGEMTRHSISYDLIAEHAALTPTILPEFEPGDALMFDERFVHRTHLTEAMTEPRYAIECWFFAPSHHSTTYAPLLV